MTSPVGDLPKRCHSANDRLRNVTFGAACRDCPFRAQCTTSKTGRSLNLHPQDAIQRAHRVRAENRDPGDLPPPPADGRALNRLAGRLPQPAAGFAEPPPTTWAAPPSGRTEPARAVDLGLTRTDGAWVIADQPSAPKSPLSAVTPTPQDHDTAQPIRRGAQNRDPRSPRCSTPLHDPPPPARPFSAVSWP